MHVLDVLAGKPHLKLTLSVTEASGSGVHDSGNQAGADSIPGLT